MKTNLALLAVLVFLSASCIMKTPADKDSNLKMSEKNFSFAQTYEVTQPANLKLSTSGGNISTYGYEGNQIEVSFIVKKQGRVLDITLEELKKLAEVEIINDKSNLEINIRKIYIRNISVGFEVKTPVKTAAFLNTSGGNITIENLSANQEMHTSGGNLDIRKITGKIEAGTSGGNVSIDHSTGDINASTSGGNIDMNHLKGNVRTSTSGGNIDLTNIEGLVDVSTSGGSIQLDSIFGSIKAETSGGNISANIVKLSDRLDLDTSGGSIDCTVPKGLGLNLNLSANNIDTPLSNFTGSAKKDRIQGQMNGGGIPVNLSTSGGSLILNYK